jgi:2-methylisocitrate lyase-like PEP mutase family enzyme
MTMGQSLRERLRSGFLVAPSIYDGLTALIAQRAGFEACYLCGHDVAIQRGYPDVGWTSSGERLDDVRYVADALSIPMIAEAHTSSSDELHMARIVREYESAGAAGLLVGDQISSPVGFGGDPQLLSVAEAVAMLHVASETRTNPDVVIIAGTGALASNGWADTLDRVDAYRQAGADLVFIASIEGLADLERYAAEVASRGPTLYKGSLVPTPRVRELGFSMNIAGGGHLLSLLAVRDALLRVRAGRASEPIRNDVRFDEMTSLLGLDDVYALEARYAIERTKER